MPPKKTTTVTVHTIASHVGISAAAVSTVLANRHVERRLAPATVERIRQAVRELGYVPNIAARRLRANDPNVRQVDLAILTSFEAPLSLVERALRQMQKAADARTSPMRRYSVSIAMYHAGHLKDMSGLLSANRFHGVIITNTLPADDAFLAGTTLPYHVVVLGRRLPNYCCVLETPGATGQQAADILVDSGRSDLLVLTPSLLTQVTGDRADAFCRTVKSRIGREPIRLAKGFDPSGGAKALRSLLAKRVRRDGVFAVTDTLALGAYHAIKQMGMVVPKDLAVVGVGDHDHVGYFDPPLTCVGPVADTAVEHAVKMLFDMMVRHRSKPIEVLVPPVVARRDSV